MKIIEIFCILLIYVNAKCGAFETPDLTLTTTTTIDPVSNKCVPQCPEHADCIPRPEGFFNCKCHEGYKEDISKEGHQVCAPLCTNACENNLMCIDVEKCGCGAGYFYDQERQYCIDTNIKINPTDILKSIDNFGEIEGSGSIESVDFTKVDDETTPINDKEFTGHEYVNSANNGHNTTATTTTSTITTTTAQATTNDFGFEAAVCGKIICPINSYCDNNEKCTCPEGFIFQVIKNNIKCVDEKIVASEQNMLQHFYIALGLSCILVAILSLVVYFCHQ